MNRPRPELPAATAPGTSGGRAAAVAGFGAGVADYESGRPGYPDEVVAGLGRRLGLSPGARVGDLGAGTGKLTRALVGHGWDVVALEPVAAMRALLAETVPAARVVAAWAEALPVRAGSLDAVCVAQAFHWFDAPRALAECTRALRPKGGLAVLFNERDQREPWVAAMSAAIEWHQHSPSQYQRTDWGEVIQAGGFGPVGRLSVEWSQPVTGEVLAAQVASISYVASAAPARRRRYVEAVLALVADRAEPFLLPYVTTLWWAIGP
ncbi:MAG: class I SAM-dependent methyltransferase [Acidimicrobiia bacterium]